MAKLNMFEILKNARPLNASDDYCNTETQLQCVVDGVMYEPIQFKGRIFMFEEDDDWCAIVRETILGLISWLQEIGTENLLLFFLVDGVVVYSFSKKEYLKEQREFTAYLNKSVPKEGTVSGLHNL